MTRLIPAPTTALVLAGASRSRRSSLFCRQVTRVIPAPKVAPDAMAQPSRPGARYWIGFSDWSSIWRVASWKAAGRPARLLVCLLHDRREYRLHDAGRDLVGDGVMHDEHGALLLHHRVGVALAHVVQRRAEVP